MWYPSRQRLLSLRPLRLNLLNFKHFFLGVLFCSLLWESTFAHAEKRFSRPLGKGVRYVFYRSQVGGRPVNFHVVVIKIHSLDVAVKPVLAHNRIGRLEQVSRMAERTRAYAAINGTFFKNRRPHLPVGFIVIDGRLVNKTQLGRTTMGITQGRRVIFGIPRIKNEVMVMHNRRRFGVSGVNRPRKPNEVVIYTPEYGPRSKTNRFGREAIVRGDRVVAESTGNTPIPADGYVISCHGWARGFLDWIPIGTQVDFLTILGGDFEEVDQALTGGPRLLENGRIVVKEYVRRENFRGGILNRNARTAVGLLKTGALAFLVVEKRSWRRSYGVTYTELAQLAKRIGMREAMGLDGGGASTLYVSNRGVVNVPQDGFERLVSNALIVAPDR